jgi:hypothetical protein
MTQQKMKVRAATVQPMPFMALARSGIVPSEKKKREDGKDEGQEKKGGGGGGGI